MVPEEEVGGGFVVEPEDPLVDEEVLVEVVDELIAVAHPALEYPELPAELKALTL
jgi:hypothetical protein